MARKKTTPDNNAGPGSSLKFRGVLIVTYGRSGSTLLQGLLNAIPGCLVRGENHNLCYGLFSAYQSLLRSKSEQGWAAAMSPTSPWFGAPALAPELFLRDASALVRRQLLADADESTVHCLGFKEIRYPGLADLPKYLDFLEALFPGTAVVFLTRDLASVVNSAWWRDKNPVEVERNLTRFEQTVRAWAASRTNVFPIDYRDVSGHGEKVAELFAFLGATYDRAAVDAVLSTPHSYSPAEQGKPRRAQPVASESAPAAVPVAAPSVTAAAGKPAPWLNIRVTGKAHTRVLFFDPLPAKPAAGTTINLGGCVLPAAGLPAGMRLLLRQAGESREVAWMLPSPTLGANNPNDPAATHARFRLPVSSEFAAAELVLETADAQSWVLAKLGTEG